MFELFPQSFNQDSHEQTNGVRTNEYNIRFQDRNCALVSNDGLMG